MKYVLVLLIGWMLFGCENVEETPPTSDAKDTKADNFTIVGTIKDGQNITFYLEAQSEKVIIPVGQVTADGSGKFTMKGNIPGYGKYQLRMGETSEKVIPLTLAPGDKLKIDASYATFITPQLSGTEWSTALTEYLKQYHIFNQKKVMLQLNPENLAPGEIQRTYESMLNSFNEFALEKLDAHPGNPVNILLLPSALPGQDLNTFKKEDLNRLKRVEQSLFDKFPRSPLVTELGNQIYAIEEQYNRHQMFNTGTLEAPEIVMPDVNGNITRLSDTRGQYVLLDFWASWCGPCRRENPNVVRLYNKYKNQGFTVFSVSLDKSADAWKAAIEKDNLSWPHHVSDLMEWNSPVVQEYGFNGIPYTVLLNKEGKYIGVNLRGAALEQKLKELFEN